jgi:hypothetical protein
MRRDRSSSLVRHLSQRMAAGGGSLACRPCSGRPGPATPETILDRDAAQTRTVYAFPPPHNGGAHGGAREEPASRLCAPAAEAARGIGPTRQGRSGDMDPQHYGGEGNLSDAHAAGFGVRRLARLHDARERLRTGRGRTTGGEEAEAAGAGDLS